MLQFTPLSGPYVDGSEGTVSSTECSKALAYLVEIDQVRILLDCGAPEDFTFPASLIKTDDADRGLHGSLPDILQRIGPSIDVVLLFHAELSHMGLYAYAYAHYGLQCPVYATLPVQTMGRLQMLEVVRSWKAEADVGTSAPVQRFLPTEAQVDEAFDAIRSLRYMQPTPLDGKCAGLVLTAYNAGHSLGGTVWKLRSPSVGTVVMALDWNHHRERHLDGTALLSVGAAAPLAHAIGQPDILITDMERGLYTNARRKDRDAALLEQIHKTLTSGHSVLIPVDSAARMLEILVLLDQHWAFAYQHQRFPLCLVSHTGQEVLERARTFMEWMSRDWAIQLLDMPEKGRGRKKQALTKSPLDFTALRHFASVEALHQALAPSQVKVVLATPPALSHGLSRQLLPEFLNDPGSLLVLTGRGDPNSLVRTLWERWNATQADAAAWRTGRVGTPATLGGQLSYELRRRVPLAGDELRAYMEAHQAASDKASATTRPAHPQREADEGLSDSDASSDDDDDDAMMRSSAGAAKPSANEEEGVSSSSAPLDMSFDIFLRGHASRDEGLHYRMFPFIERKRKVDGYGEFIDTARWLSRRQKLEAEQEEQLDPSRAKPAPKKEAPVEVPSKYTCETLSVALRCHVLYIDLQGLSDGRALTTLVPQLQPRRLIMVNGDAPTRAELGAMLSSHELYMPTTGATITVGGLSDSYSVRLGDALMGGLNWHRMEDYNVVHLHVTPDFSGDAETPTLVPCHDATTLQAAQAPSTLYIGDLRLSALKAYLARQHRIRADFAGEGVLVCSDRGQRHVTVTKQGTGRIVVEGNLSSSLARVRQSIYQLVAQVHQ
ncbi:hypothetical protein MEQU1_001499 [Malassezia equina]|uniref:Cleavage and polyadenylation specificity factor subunit 2 n=1 Tax=Malassezia equina TaxID=1381935 RepID=A0AAF0IYX1_9BASI|nr:hypothetical protein MEQU1_001499 [Malassezia equina]